MSRWDFLQPSPSSPTIKISVIATEGSTPRRTHSCMVVSGEGAEGREGSVGGGALEFKALEIAEKLLKTGGEKGGGWVRHVEEVVLGRDLRQSCGGKVVLLFEYLGEAEKACYRDLLAEHDDGFILVPHASGEAVFHSGKPANDLDIYSEPIRREVPQLYLFGAGHVGRAVAYHVSVLDFSLCWVDFDEGRFPAEAGDLCDEVWVSDSPAGRVGDCEKGAYYLVMSHSHELDYEIVSAILRRGDFAFVGLIGSRAKGVRFRQNLLRDGIAKDMVDRLVSPIGLFRGGDNTPHGIAVSVVAQLCKIHAQ